MSKSKAARYLGNLFVSIDQLGNAFAGGDADNTISARVGFFANHGSKRYQWYWKILERIVNFTFWPVDGPGHCHMAYHSDAGEDFNPGNNVLVHLLLWIFVLLICIPLIVVLYLFYALQIVKPRMIDHQQAISGRLRSVKKKLDGIIVEIKEESVVSDQQMLGSSRQMLNKAKDADDIINSSKKPE
ncbi:hypothetical protein [Roseivirga sp. E12]|uniref:hypothetical protein n=1 Tax=Roseivirga sp. E12 TaxID=2819237 RepID=UPI001ABCBC55|nr:hypothetical protein [Roseivirga sp. E12]MBO3697269.1 hypothetical protein [Roseivirga sp. E12]